MQKYLKTRSYNVVNTSNAVVCSLKKRKNTEFDACVNWETVGFQIRVEEKKGNKDNFQS